MQTDLQAADGGLLTSAGKPQGLLCAGLSLQVLPVVRMDIQKGARPFAVLARSSVSAEEMAYFTKTAMLTCHSRRPRTRAQWGSSRRP